MCVQLWDPIFKVNYWISYGVPAEQFIVEVRQEFGIIVSESELFDGYARDFERSDGYIYWAWTRKKSLPELVHEIIHLVAMNLVGKQIKLDGNADELYAYTVQWILEEVLKQNGKTETVQKPDSRRT